MGKMPEGTCPYCGKVMSWVYLYRHVHSHLPHPITVDGRVLDYSSVVCWCGERFGRHDNWSRHVRKAGGLVAHLLAHLAWGFPMGKPRCPFCEQTCKDEEIVLWHVFYAHLDGTNYRKDCGQWIVDYLCWCDQPRAPHQRTPYGTGDLGLGKWISHLDQHGGLYAHLLAHHLGVPSG